VSGSWVELLCGQLINRGNFSIKAAFKAYSLEAAWLDVLFNKIVQVVNNM